MAYTIPKGVFDILPVESDPSAAWRLSHRWRYVEEVMRQTAADYGFQEIRTPLFERTELFERTSGESSDIVTKEMYTFLDRGGRSLTLRPEGTAPVVRALIEKQLLQRSAGVHKFYYMGPMFRYERPQAGRYRQHHQFGAEVVGVAAPEQDVEVIDMLCTLYTRLGLQQLQVLVNSVGDGASRALFQEALKGYLLPYFDELSPESQARFSKNALRILDSKDGRDRELLEGAPRLADFLTAECRAHFDRVCALLEELGIAYVVHPRLVRGLDYYNKTVFEVIRGDQAQNTIGAGGRYDGLIGSLGGPDLPAVGFAVGIERALQTMQAENVAFPEPPAPDLFLIGLGDDAFRLCFSLLAQLRRRGCPAEMELQQRKLSQALQVANALRARYVLILGDEEMRSGRAQLKEMQSREARPVALSELLDTLTRVSRERSMALCEPPK